MSGYSVLIFYISCFLIQSCTILKAILCREELKNSGHQILQEVERFQYFYFTVWSYVLQMIFVAIAILDELAKLLDISKEIKRKLEWFRAFVFNTFSFPCSYGVMTIFWTVWNIDRELVFPAVIDTVIPPWVNYSLHGFIFLPGTIEFFLPKKNHFMTFSDSVKILIPFVIFYQMVYMSIYFRFGVWLYQMYQYMNWQQRFLFSLSQIGMALFYLKIGIDIQNRKKVKEGRKFK